MSKSRDPGRLEDQGSSELTSMIDALRGDGPSRASMQRMAKNLDTKLKTSPASPAGIQSIQLLGKIAVVLVSGALLAVVAGVT